MISFCKEKLAPLLLRVVLGSICVYHGYDKISVAGGTTWYPGMPTGWQMAIAWGQFAGGLAVLAGYWCRIATSVIFGLTVGTIAWYQGWQALKLPVHTLEPTVMLLTISLTLVVFGAGGISIDGHGGGKSLLGRLLQMK